MKLKATLCIYLIKVFKTTTLARKRASPLPDYFIQTIGNSCLAIISTTTAAKTVCIYTFEEKLNRFCKSGRFIQYQVSYRITERPGFQA